MDDAFPIQEAAREARRHKLTLADFQLLSDHGHLDRDRVYALIDGWVVPMAGEGGPHRDYKEELIWFIARALSDEYRLAVETQLDLDENNAVQPDLFVHSSTKRASEVHPTDVLLLLEIADTSVKDDLALKAPRYAAFGVREYWVIDIPNRQVLVHRDRTDEGAWAEPASVPASETAICAAIPALALRLDDFERLRPAD